MSCFMVSDEHINVMVWSAWAFSVSESFGGQMPYGGEELYIQWPRTGEYESFRLGDRREPNVPDLTRLGQILVDGNRDSVDARYSEQGGRETYEFSWPRSTSWSAEECIRAIDCYEYQSCEAPDWYISDARCVCDRFRRILSDRIVDRAETRTEGGRFEWEIDFDSEPAKPGFYYALAPALTGKGRDDFQVPSFILSKCERMLYDAARSEDERQSDALHLHL